MPNLNPSPHSDPEVLTRFQEELARAATMPGLATAGPALWPRFAGYYHGLARLPRKARRALQRRWRRSLGGIALLCALGQAPALAATINVGGACTLVDAITAANNDASIGGCTAGSGADTLVLPPGSIHTLTAVNNNSYRAGLPGVTSAITIAGNGSTITRDPGAPPFRILEVAETGDLTLQKTTVSGGVITVSDPSGSGGGLFNSGILTLTNSTVSGDSAGSDGGGVRNYGTLTLVQTVVSGNAASAQGPEVNNTPIFVPAGTVIANNLNLFGHDGLAGVVGFVQGPTDNVPSGPLAAILNPTLADNGGPTRTHALVPASPAVDAVPAGNCVTTTDQRSAPRPQDRTATGPRSPTATSGLSSWGRSQRCGRQSESTGPLHGVTLQHPHQVQSRPGLGGSVYRPDRLLREPKRCPVDRTGIDEGAKTDPVRRRHYQHPGGRDREREAQAHQAGQEDRTDQHAKEPPGRHGDPKLGRDFQLDTDSHQAQITRPGRPPVLAGAHGRAPQQRAFVTVGCARRYPHSGPPGLSQGREPRKSPCPRYVHDRAALAFVPAGPEPLAVSITS